MQCEKEKCVSALATGDKVPRSAESTGRKWLQERDRLAVQTMRHAEVAERAQSAGRVTLRGQQRQLDELIEGLRKAKRWTSASLNPSLAMAA